MTVLGWKAFNLRRIHVECFKPDFMTIRHNIVTYFGYKEGLRKLQKLAMKDKVY